MPYSVIFITGGASGLGEATARRFSAEGYKVAIADMNVERGQQLARELPDCAFFKMDVTKEDEIIAALDGTVARFGAVHVVVNSAGILTSGFLVSKRKGPLPADSLRKVLEINVVGTFNVCKHAAERMMKQELDGKREQRGVIINVASLAGIEGQIGQTVYAGSKGAIIGFTLPMARELGRYQIRVVTLAPGLFQTPMSHQIADKITEGLGKQTALGRLGLPDEFADVVVGAVNSSYLTGVVIRLGGGTRLGHL